MLVASLLVQRVKIRKSQQYLISLYDFLKILRGMSH